MSDPVRSKKLKISAEDASRTSNGISYTIKKHRRAKYMRLSVYPDGRVVLTLPYWVAKYKGKDYVEEKREWILEQIKNYEKKQEGKITLTRTDYLRHKEAARKLITERVAYFNQFYNFSYKRISVKDTRTMWGSCSAKGNLNFNYKLLFLTPEQRDYVIVHELCHLKELNHSRRFWDLVRQQVPNMEQIKKELRTKKIL